jgi:hypothetical protein
MARPANFWASSDQNESSEKRVARFKQWFNRSRIGDLVKDRRYHKREKTRRLVRISALMREGFRQEKERNKYYQ